jgi:hypothetical protein
MPVVVSAVEESGASVVSQVPEGGDEATVRLVPSVERTPVSGFVRARDGSPVALASIVAVGAAVAGTRTVVRASTSADGSFRLAAPSGSRVFAGAPGMRPAEAARDAKGSLVATLAGAARVRGRVVDAAGAPIAGARVRIAPAFPYGAGYEPWNAERTSGEGGEFAFDDVPPGDRALFVGGGGWLSREHLLDEAAARNALTLRVAAGSTLVRELRAERGESVSGLVVDEEGAPIAGAIVYAAYGPSSARWTLTWDETVATDEHGAFRLESLVLGTPHEVTATAPGRRPSTAVIGWKRPRRLEPERLVLERAWWISVRAVDEFRLPAEGAALDVVEEAASGSVPHRGLLPRLDEDGRARLGPFGAAAVGVRLAATGFAPATPFRWVERPAPDAPEPLLEVGTTTPRRVR